MIRFVGYLLEVFENNILLFRQVGPNDFKFKITYDGLHHHALLTSRHGEEESGGWIWKGMVGEMRVDANEDSMFNARLESRFRLRLIPRDKLLSALTTP